MNDKPQIKLSETVALVDAAYLNYVIKDMKAHFEEKLGRPLQVIDLSELTTFLTLDAGVRGGGNGVQFLFIYDKHSSQLFHCRPSDVEGELNGVAFKNMFGEYAFASVPSEGMVSREDLFLDLLSIVADSDDVKKMVIVSFDEEYGDRVVDALNEVKGKVVLQFRMNEPEVLVRYKWDILAFPIMRAFGIRPDELE